jgi:hypothetical protein
VWSALLSSIRPRLMGLDMSAPPCGPISKAVGQPPSRAVHCEKRMLERLHQLSTTSPTTGFPSLTNTILYPLALLNGPSCSFPLSRPGDSQTRFSALLLANQ